MAQQGDVIGEDALGFVKVGIGGDGFGLGGVFDGRRGRSGGGGCCADRGGEAGLGGSLDGDVVGDGLDFFAGGAFFFAGFVF